jgi:hypothetical protein
MIERGAPLTAITWLDPSRWAPVRARQHGSLFALVLSVSTLAALAIWQGREVQRRTLPGNPRQHYAWNAFSEWDWLFLSAFATIICGCWLATSAQPRFEALLTRLAAGGLLATTAKTGERTSLAASDSPGLVSRTREQSAVLAHRFGVVLAVAVPAWLYAQGMLSRGSWLGGSAVEHVGVMVLAWILVISAGYFVGRAIGSLASHRIVGAPFGRGQLVPDPRPGHIDGAAGLRPIGWFYFCQALLAAIPTLFIGTWIALMFSIQHLEDRYALRNYANWRTIYIVLLPVSMSLQVIVFLRPLWKTHLTMTQRRESLLGHAELKAEEIRKIRAELEEDLGAQKRSDLRERLADLERGYYAIEKMPTWPVNSELWHRFWWWLVAQAGAIAGATAISATKLS